MKIQSVFITELREQYNAFFLIETESIQTVLLYETY